MSTRRDYKHTATGQRRRQTVRRHGLLVVTLVLIGLFGGLLAYIKGDRNLQPTTAAASLPTPAGPVRPPSPPPPVVAAPAPAVAEPVPVKPKYDFYTELPKRQIEIRREEINPHSVQPPSPPARTQPAGDQQHQKPAAPRRNNAASLPVVASPTAGGSAKPGLAHSIPSATPKPAHLPQKPVQPLAQAQHGSTTVVKTP